MIAELLAATPYPPATDDVDELLAAAAAMVRARDRILGSAERAGGEPAQAVELEARQEAWRVALETARNRLGGQRVATRNLRAYAAAYR